MRLHTNENPILHDCMLRNLPNKFELGRSPEDNFMPQIARKIGNFEGFFLLFIK